MVSNDTKRALRRELELVRSTSARASGKMIGASQADWQHGAIGKTLDRLAGVTKDLLTGKTSVEEARAFTGRCAPVETRMDRQRVRAARSVSEISAELAKLPRVQVRRSPSGIKTVRDIAFAKGDVGLFGQPVPRAGENKDDLCRGVRTMFQRAMFPPFECDARRQELKRHGYVEAYPEDHVWISDSESDASQITFKAQRAVKATYGGREIEDVSMDVRVFKLDLSSALGAAFMGDVQDIWRRFEHRPCFVLKVSMGPRAREKMRTHLFGSSFSDDHPWYVQAVEWAAFATVDENAPVLGSAKYEEFV
ncbi:hypothetical protein [uncultured Tateyamaria sp.]|uniref:hypothetical protein n=1 Tax=uncultured Tateyamaria sp. TaxID=455651 RepID=UPI0026194279|nr:hypothetical protein [uncultured Tateyamaria sp.]